jgi:hypothetical protein
MPVDRVAGIRVERRAPRAHGLGGGWFVSCEFAGRSWNFRFYGYEWVFPREDDAAAWKALTADQRRQLREAATDALEKAQLAHVHRQNHWRQLRSAMRWEIGAGLRHKLRPAPRRNVVFYRPRDSRRGDSWRGCAGGGIRRARAPASPEDSEPPPSRVARPRKRGAAL